MTTDLFSRGPPKACLWGTHLWGAWGATPRVDGRRVLAPCQLLQSWPCGYCDSIPGPGEALADLSGSYASISTEATRALHHLCGRTGQLLHIYLVEYWCCDPWPLHNALWWQDLNSSCSQTLIYLYCLSMSQQRHGFNMRNGPQRAPLIHHFLVMISCQAVLAYCSLIYATTHCQIA